MRRTHVYDVCAGEGLSKTQSPCASSNVRARPKCSLRSCCSHLRTRGPAFGGLLLGRQRCGGETRVVPNPRREAIVQIPRKLKGKTGRKQDKGWTEEEMKKSCIQSSAEAHRR